MAEVAVLLPPYAQITDFLPEDEHRRLLDWAISIQDEFVPATVYKGQPKRLQRFQVDPERRVCLYTRNLGPLEPVLRKRLLGALPELMAATGIGGPPPTSLELELAAHADGAYFRPHLDIPVGANRQALGAEAGEDRVLSAVYYFHSEPKAFTGGQLRLFAFGPIPADDDEQRAHINLEPVRNSLAAFPSWVPHEVRPVSCPSREFSNYRFALNCWYCRSLTSQSSHVS